jgi:FAD/FMN-containing dehydrogenase
MRYTNTIGDTHSAATPGDIDYTNAISAFNLLPQISPARTVIATSVRDVLEALTTANELGLTVGVLATGHSLGTARPLDYSLLVRTAFDVPVEVDPERRIARIPAGATWGDVVQAATAHGLAAPHGSSPTVGAIGYLLRGGMSFYGRKYGVAANHILSITVVLADGRIETVSADHDPELFWALRGGGGGFGIVTEIELELFPMWRVLTGITIWDSAFAAELIPLWLEWTKTAPRDISTSLRILNVPPVPGIPDFLAGRQVLAIDGAVAVETVGDLQYRNSFADELLSPMLAISEPLMSTWDLVTPDVLTSTHMDPMEPLPYVGDHFLVDGVTEGDIATLLELVGPGSGSMLTAVEFRQLGSAFREPRVDGGAFDRIDADFAFLMIGAVGGPATADYHHDTMAAVRDALRPRDTGFTSPTFVESHHQPSRTFDAATYDRVDAVRRRVDPDGLFEPGISRPVL